MVDEPSLVSSSRIEVYPPISTSNLIYRAFFLLRLFNLSSQTQKMVRLTTSGLTGLLALATVANAFPGASLFQVSHCYV